MTDLYRSSGEEFASAALLFADELGELITGGSSFAFWLGFGMLKLGSWRMLHYLGTRPMNFGVSVRPGPPFDFTHAPESRVLVYFVTTDESQFNESAQVSRKYSSHVQSQDKFNQFPLLQSTFRCSRDVLSMPRIWLIWQVRVNFVEYARLRWVSRQNREHIEFIRCQESQEKEGTTRTSEGQPPLVPYSL